MSVVLGKVFYDLACDIEYQRLEEMPMTNSYVILGTELAQLEN
jgi:hypothetical protein